MMKDHCNAEVQLATGEPQISLMNAVPNVQSQHCSFN